MKNVLEWLEATVEKYPDKPAFSDTECSITFAQVYDIARNTGAYLIEQLGVDRTPVAVFAGRKMVTPAYFLGVVYADRMRRLMHRFLTRELKKYLKICVQGLLWQTGKALSMWRA